jgi:hypothetical protein
MMFRRSLIDLVFPDDDETFRLHMDFYVVVMAQMVSGSLLIDEPLYSYRLHGRNFAANNPVLGGRLHLSARNWGGTYAEMLDRMLAAMIGGRERFVAALGERQLRRMLLRMRQRAQAHGLAGFCPPRLVDLTHRLRHPARCCGDGLGVGPQRRTAGIATI